MFYCVIVHVRLLSPREQTVHRMKGYQQLLLIHNSHVSIIVCVELVNVRSKEPILLAKF